MLTRTVLGCAIVALAGVGAQASCLTEVGATKANLYVRQCLDVSPATHPPCNVSNACALIIGEIKRSCQLLASDAPTFCRQYAGGR